MGFHPVAVRCCGGCDCSCSYSPSPFIQTGRLIDLSYSIEGCNST